jgi:hypothetical protein
MHALFWDNKHDTNFNAKDILKRVANFRIKNYRLWPN